MRSPTPTNMTIAPTQSHELSYIADPTIIIPLITPITTETLSLCISFIVHTVVNSTVTPPIIITPHCQIQGTMIWKAGNRIGITMAVNKRNWWATAQKDESRRVKSYAFIIPKNTPGINSNNFFQQKFYSMIRLPATTINSRYPQYQNRFPLNDSQRIANKIPPDPFHPQIIEIIIPPTARTHILLSLESYSGSGRNGISSYFLIIAVQLIRNANKVVTKQN